MSNERSSKLARWREKYGAVVIALSCLCSAITIWEDNWVLTSVLLLGVLVCGTIGVFDIKRGDSPSPR